MSSNPGKGDAVLDRLESGESAGPSLVSDIYDFLELVTSNEVNILRAKRCLLKVQLQSEERQEEFWSAFLDVFWFMETEYEQLNPDTNVQRPLLLRKLLIDIRNSGILPLEVVLERLEPSMLKEIGILDDDSAFKKREIQLRSKILFKQEKFNLLREESEGYAKLLSLVYSPKVPTSEEEIDIFKDNLFKIIGTFRIDPNRVLSILLERLEQNPANEFFLSVVLDGNIFNSSSIANVLGFRFQRSAVGRSGTKEKRIAPQSLYTLTGRLLAGHVFSLEDIWPHLSPDDEELREKYKEYCKAKEKTVGELGAMNLLGNSSKEKPGKIALRELESFLFSSNNQKVTLAGECIASGDERLALKVLSLLGGVDAAVAKGVRLALVGVLDRHLRPLCESVFPRFEPDVLCTEKVHEALETIRPFALALSYHLSGFPITFGRLCRFLRYAARTEAKEKVGELVIESVLPALSLTQHSPSLSFEVWEVLKNFQYEERFQIYGKWMTKYSEVTEMERARKEAEIEMKKVLRRLTKDSVKAFGRVIAKTTHSNPLAVFHSFLPQVEVYGNIIHPIVDSLRYLTSLSWDILVYCLLTRLAKERGRIKEDGITVEDYLQHLSTFTGLLFKKYPLKNGIGVDHDLELGAVLFFVASQLADHNPIDILLLSRLVTEMSGIPSIEESLSPHQLYCRAGDSVLRFQSYVSAGMGGPNAGFFSSRHGYRRSSARLQEALATDGRALLLASLVALNKTALRCTTTSKHYTNHLKFIGHFIDDCSSLIFKIREFLRQYISEEQYANLIPNVRILMEEYHMDLPTAFYLSRPGIRTHEPDSISGEIQRMLKSGKSSSENKGDEGARGSETSFVRMLPVRPSLWDEVDADLFEVFWSLSFYDIHTPTAQYEAEIRKAKSQLRELEEEEKEAGEKANRKAKVREEERRSESEAAKRRRQKEKLNALVSKLAAENTRQKASHSVLIRKLKERCKNWYSAAFEDKDGKSGDSKKVDHINRFIQECVYPRRTFSPEDALYTAMFVKVLNSMETPYFSTLMYCDAVLKDLMTHVCACTQNEANMLSFWLQYTVEMLKQWHDSQEIYQKECANKPGFSRSHIVTSKGFTTHSDFCKILRMWMDYLMKTFTECLKSPEFVPVRNTFILLTKIHDSFPHTPKAAKEIESLIIPFTEDEERPDIQILAKMYLAHLKKHLEDLTKPTVSSSVSKSPRSPMNRSRASSRDRDRDREREREREDRERQTDKDKERSRKRERSIENTPQSRLKDRERALEKEREKEMERNRRETVEEEREKDRLKEVKNKEREMSEVRKQQSQQQRAQKSQRPQRNLRSKTKEKLQEEKKETWEEVDLETPSEVRSNSPSRERGRKRTYKNSNDDGTSRELTQGRKRRSINRAVLEKRI